MFISQASAMFPAQFRAMRSLNAFNQKTIMTGWPEEKPDGKISVLNKLKPTMRTVRNNTVWHPILTPIASVQRDDID